MSKSAFSPVPSALTTKTPRSVSPAGDMIAANEILVMSGENVGYSGGCGGWKRSSGFMPSRLSCQMLETRPGPLRRKSVPRPFGNHAGWLEACPSGDVVSRRCPRPAAVILAISKFTRAPGLRIA